MLKKVIKIIIALVFGLIGYTISEILRQNFIDQLPGKIITTFISIIIFALLGYILSESIIKKVVYWRNHLDAEMQSINPYTVLLTITGAFIGIVAAFFISGLINEIFSTLLKNVLLVIIYAVLGALGAMLGSVLSSSFIKDGDKKSKLKSKSTSSQSKKLSNGKLLDTSVIIDGRIADILATGFLEGPIILPEFVLLELQTIADNKNELKRAKGKRGIDILERIKSNKKINIEIINNDYEDIQEVDTKLIKLAKDINAKIITNDYNLNKISTLQGIDILNVNELANSIKTVVLPGENLSINIMKKGKENKQGLGYLNDGTMVVIENGQDLIGEDVIVTVDSVLQTSAGKMIFTHPNDEVESII